MLIQFKFFRRLFGGSYQKIWFYRQSQGGYTAWRKARPGFDWETINGRILDEENYGA